MSQQSVINTYFTKRTHVANNDNDDNEKTISNDNEITYVDLQYWGVGLEKKNLGGESTLGGYLKF